MSLDALAWVWRHSRATKNDLLVLLAIADYADDKAEAFPSVGAIAARARIDRATVYRCVHHLETLQELVVDRREDGRVRDNGSSTSNLYHLPGVPLPDGGGSQIATGEGRRLRHPTTRGKTAGGSQPATGRVAAVRPPEPSIEKKTRRRRSPETTWPASLSLDAAMRATAKDAGVEDPAWQSREFRKFHAHADTHDRRCANWRGAWRQWCLHAVEYADRDGRGHGSTSNEPSYGTNIT